MTSRPLVVACAFALIVGTADAAPPAATDDYQRLTTAQLGRGGLWVDALPTGTSSRTRRLPDGSTVIETSDGAGATTRGRLHVKRGRGVRVRLTEPAVAVSVENRLASPDTGDGRSWIVTLPKRLDRRAGQVAILATYRFATGDSASFFLVAGVRVR